MKDVLEACMRLFDIRIYLAQGIISVLRIEDVRIAFAKSIQKKAPPTSNTTTGTHTTKSEVWLLNHCYNTLTSYINNNNIESAMTMDLFSKESPHKSELAYLYPIPHEQQSQNASLRSLQRTKNLFYNGKMLVKKMRFGTYLYYRGIISYYMLLESLAWQKNQRPLIGQIAMQIGYLKPKQFAEILLHIKHGYSFGEVAREKKLLTNSLILKIVNSQERFNCKIGNYFIDQAILTSNQVDMYYQQMIKHNSQFLV